MRDAANARSRACEGDVSTIMGSFILHTRARGAASAFRCWKPALPFALALALGACASGTIRPEPLEVPAGDGVAVTHIDEAFLGPASPGSDIDSIATWLTPEGDTWVIASAKSAGQIFVHDGGSGALLRQIGEPGAFMYPNGVAVFGDALLVIERDAARVQVLSLPDFEPLGSFGENWLVAPYGLWLYETAPGEIEVYVTDSYQSPEGVPALERLDQRVKRFRVRLDEEPIRAWLLDAFGGTAPDSALRHVESIAGDVAFDRLVIADEHPDHSSAGPLLYSLDGSFHGLHLGEGLFQGDPEGIALYECPSGNGYWIATDQGVESNRFHVFDRASLAYLGSFSANALRNTDGIALHPGASERFPYGVLYAVHDDSAIAALDWRDIANALNLWLDCPE